mgnify:FL=1
MSDQSQEKQKAEQAYQVRESLIDFPTDFPIKVMGKKTLALSEEIFNAIKTYDPELKLADVKKSAKESSKGNYVSYTVTVRAHSKKQLDDIYHVLTAHPLVKIVL